MRQQRADFGAMLQRLDAVVHEFRQRGLIQGTLLILAVVLSKAASRGIVR